MITIYSTLNLNDGNLNLYITMKLLVTICCFLAAAVFTGKCIV